MIADVNTSFVWWPWVADHRSLIVTATEQHLQQTGIAVGVGFAISIVLAAVAIRFRWTLRPITWLTATIYTIPSLSLFAILIPITHLTLLTAEIALVGYSLISLVPNIVVGLTAVPTAVVDAADGLGLTRAQRFTKVLLPIAVPEIIAGLRITTVSTIGLVTIASYVGLGGGFGALITDGTLKNNFSTEIVLGVAGSITLAIAFDLVFVVLGRLVTPWARVGQGSGAPAR